MTTTPLSGKGACDTGHAGQNVPDMVCDVLLEGHQVRLGARRLQRCVAVCPGPQKSAAGSHRGLDNTWAMAPLDIVGTLPLVFHRQDDRGVALVNTGLPRVYRTRCSQHMAATPTRRCQ
jgi:hypothetical protein